MLQPQITRWSPLACTPTICRNAEPSVVPLLRPKRSISVSVAWYEARYLLRGQRELITWMQELRNDPFNGSQKLDRATR